MLAVPGYDKKIEFGVLVFFAYPVEESCKCLFKHYIEENILCHSAYS